MRRYCKLKGVKQKIDHHKFNELIGRGLLNPVNKWPKRYKKNQKTESGKRKRPPTATRQAPRFTSETLCHTRGVLNKHIDSSLNHLTVKSPRDDDDKKKGNSIVCQLHRWAQREKYDIPTIRDPNDVPISAIPSVSQRNVMYCNA